MEKDSALKPAAEELQAVAPETTLKMEEAPATTSGTQPTWAQAQWASIKSKAREAREYARDAREYAVTRTRQTFSMFGEAAKAESADKGGGASKDESSSPQ